VSRDLAIDLGTANTLVWRRGQGIVFNEPSVVARDTKTGNVLAIGREAYNMIGRTPGHIVAERPLRGGAITDFDTTSAMIRLLLKRVGVTRMGRSRTLICVPSAITPVERRAVEESAEQAGASKAYLIEQPMAAAIGAKLPVEEPTGSLIVDIGGGTSEVAVMSLGGVVAHRAVRLGGFDFDATLQTHVRRVHALAVGERTAEELKIAIGSAYPQAEEPRAEIRGRELATGLPKVITVGAEEVREALEEPLSSIVEAVRETLGSCPPELAEDILSDGIRLVGGGALLLGVDARLTEETEVPARVLDTPLETVVTGAGRTIEAFDQYRHLFVAD
jgi:rod shape-determining protein MreB